MIEFCSHSPAGLVYGYGPDVRLRNDGFGGCRTQNVKLFVASLHKVVTNATGQLMVPKLSSWNTIAIMHDRIRERCEQTGGY